MFGQGDSLRSADGALLETDVVPPAPIRWALQPSLLVVVYLAARDVIPYLGVYGALLGSFATLTIAERLWPARREWTQSGTEWLQVAAMFAISGSAIFLLEALAKIPDAGFFSPLHAAADVLVPESWPFPVQVVIAFALMQFMAYWLHRWQHEIGVMWRTFGHGTHHSYTKLSAINWNTAHPFEAVLLVLPALFVAICLGRPEVAVVAGAMVMVISACAHANLRLNERGIGLVLTTNSQHMRHHSAVFAESQTNYGCAMTFWDRVFGTFEDGHTVALGDKMDGERTLWRRLTEPMKAP